MIFIVEFASTVSKKYIFEVVNVPEEPIYKVN